MRIFSDNATHCANQYRAHADVGAAPTAGLSSAVRHTADEALTVAATEVSAANTAALESAQTAATAVGDELADSPRPARREKNRQHTSGNLQASSTWQDACVLAQLRSRLQMSKCRHYLPVMVRCSLA